MNPIHIIGGGLAGSEAAWQAARRGVPVILHEMRPERTTEAHKTDRLAELVCSNSFRSDDRETNAVGLLHEELRRADSLIMRIADSHQVPGRRRARRRSRRLLPRPSPRRSRAHPLIRIERGEVAGLPPADWDSVIVATGPLTSPALAAGDSRAHRRGRASPSSMPSRRSSTSSRSTWTSPGSSRATTRPARAAPARTISTARSTKPAYDAFVDALSAGERHKSPRLGEGPLFRRLPARSR